VVRALADFYFYLARAWPSMFAYQHILEAEITTLDEQSTASEQARAGAQDGPR